MHIFSYKEIVLKSLLKGKRVRMPMMGKDLNVVGVHKYCRWVAMHESCLQS